MGLFRQTWAFGGAQGTTWEEVYDVDSATDLSAMPEKTDSVVLNRMALAHATVSLQHITNRDLQDPSRPPFQQSFGNTGTAANSGGNPANTDEAAVINLFCSNLEGSRIANRKLWLRGLEEEAVSRAAVSGADVLSDDFRDNLSRFLQSLQGSSTTVRRYGMLPRTRASWNGPLFRWKITAIIGGPNVDVTTITVDGNSNIDVGLLIQINDTSRKILPGLRGPFTVLASGVNEVTVAYRCPQVNPPVSGYLYVIEKPEFCFVVRARSGFAFLGSRQTKKPVTRSRGRRSAVRLRR